MASPLVVWVGRMRSTDGYGAAARACLKALRSAQIRHIAIDLDDGDPFGDVDPTLFTVHRAGHRTTVDAVDETAPVVVVVHDRPDRYDRVAAHGRVRRVGFSYFEAATLPAGWIESMIALDEIWTSASGNAETFIRAGAPAWMVHTVPLPLDLDTSLADDDTSALWGDATVLLTIASGLQRRDLRLLIEAHATAFDRDDDVVLVIKSRANTSAEIEASIEAVRAAHPLREEGTWPRIEIIDQELTREQMVRLHAAADAYVAIERGDGWGVPSVESMALRRPVVGIAWGGGADVLDPADSYIVPVGDSYSYGLESVPRENPLYSDHLWPTVKPADFARQLRAVVDDPDERRRRGAAAAERVRRSLDPITIGTTLSQRFATYREHDLRGSRRASVEISTEHPIWYRASTPQAGMQLELELLETALGASGGALRRIARYGELSSFVKRHRNELRPSTLVDAVNRAMRTSLRSPINKARAIARVSGEAAAAARLAGGVDQVRADLRTMHEHRRAVGGARLTGSAETIAERRRTVWRRYGGVRSPERDRGRLATLRDRHAGQRIVILGNGPSLNRVDLGLLRDEFTFGANRIYLKFPDLDWRPTFYTALDWRMGPAIADDLEALDGMTRFFPERFRGLLPVTEDTFWFWPRPVGDRAADHFTTDATTGVPSRGTVLVTAIQLAMHLGFRDLVLIGVDASYTVGPTVKQSGPDAFGTGTKLLLESTENDDPNHFDPSYFGAGAKWHDPNVAEMKRMFRLMRKGVERHGGTLRNATKGGELEELERVEYETLFG